MRKKGANGEQSRQSLLEIAAHEFAHKGYHGTKVSDIVARAGLTQPSFYLYFSNKEAVFEELVSSFRSKFQERIIKSRIEPGIQKKRVSEKILNALTSVFRFLAEDRNLTKIGFLISPEAAKLKEEMTALMRENLMAEQRTGYFRSALDMSIAADCLMGAIERLTITQLLPDLKTPEALAYEVMNVFLYSMLPNDEEPVSSTNLQEIEREGK